MVAWWEEQAKVRDWSTATGFRYLSTIAEALEVGRKRLNGHVLPTAEARERIGEQRRTAARRSEIGANIRAIEDPEAIAALLDAAREEGPEVNTFVIVLLDAGIRRGEALALR